MNCIQGVQIQGFHCMCVPFIIEDEAGHIVDVGLWWYSQPTVNTQHKAALKDLTCCFSLTSSSIFLTVSDT